MDKTKNKKRKITDYFSPVQIKIKSGDKMVTQGTQTDEVYEITSMKKEGLKFLVSRFFNYESKRATYSYRMCSIADDHFYLKSDTNESNSAASGIDANDSIHFDLCYSALDFLRKTHGQYFGTFHYFDRDEETFDKYKLKAMELNLASPNSFMVDAMTQYGEDNPDEDFFEGMKFMAKRIIEYESQRLEIPIDDHWDLLYGCSEPFYCNRCCNLGCRRNHLDSVDPVGTNGSCDSTEIDSDDSTCPCTSKKCFCEECDCVDNRRIEMQSGPDYQKYQVWRSNTPGQG